MKQTMHNTRVRWVLGILIALTLAFIWGNSMQSRAVSGGMSGSLKTWLEQLLHTEISEFLLRKAAHFSEYSLLGVEFSLLLGLQYDKNGKNLQCGRNLLDFPLIGMLCAVTDETIQNFLRPRFACFRCVDRHRRLFDRILFDRSALSFYQSL